LYNELLRNIYDGVVITNLSGRIVYANPRATESLLYNEEELQRLSILDVISGSDAKLLDSIWQNLADSRFTVIKALCLCQDGSYFPSEFSVSKLWIEEAHLCFFFRDITVQRQKEEMLRTEHNAIQNADSGIAVANCGGLLEYVNPATARMWGFSNPDDATNVDLSGFFAEPEKVQELIASVLEGGQTWTGEMDAIRVDGSRMAVHVSAVCNHNTDGDVVGLVFSFADISDRQRAEEALRVADRQRVMLESVGAACHHMSQPVTILLTNLELMERLGFQGETMKELALLSKDAAKVLGSTLHRLNAVDTYRTESYLTDGAGAKAPASTIVEI
jgi:PAS domain S-box-containing protein